MSKSICSSVTSHTQRDGKRIPAAILCSNGWARIWISFFLFPGLTPCPGCHIIYQLAHMLTWFFRILMFLTEQKHFFLGEKKAFFLCFSFTDLNSTDAWDPCVSQVAAWHPSWDELAQLHAWEIDHQVPFRYMRRGSSQSWLVYIRASHFLSFFRLGNWYQ